jgi:hypothetical protein
LSIFFETKTSLPVELYTTPPKKSTLPADFYTAAGIFIGSLPFRDELFVSCSLNIIF